MEGLDARSGSENDDQVYRKGPPHRAVSLGAYLQPATFLFQTREGSIGILQITEVTDNPRGVKIRYKLVQNGATNGASASVGTKAALTRLK